MCIFEFPNKIGNSESLCGVSYFAIGFENGTKLKIISEIKSLLQIANFKLEGYNPFNIFFNLVAFYISKPHFKKELRIFILEIFNENFKRPKCLWTT